MPEGDTIHRTAATLRRVLVGRRLTGFAAPRLVGATPRAGDSIEDVQARGKHLLVRFGRGLTLHTHMQMTGSWHVYRPGEPWRKSRAAARVVLETDDVVAVCFAAPVVEIVATTDLDRHPELTRLGPDLTAPRPDLDRAARRFETVASPDTEIGVALLDQRIACGVGNVYKSETLFLCGVDPFARVADISRSARRDLLATASRLLRENVDRPRRTTVPEGLAVYGRAGKPCRRCGTPIRSRRQGLHARTTYWCPRCQASTGP